MKLQGPYRVGRTNGDDKTAYVYDGDNNIICYATKKGILPIGVQLDRMRTIAAELNFYASEMIAEKYETQAKRKAIKPAAKGARR